MSILGGVLDTLVLTVNLPRIKIHEYVDKNCPAADKNCPRIKYVDENSPRIKYIDENCPRIKYVDENCPIG